MDSWMTSLTSGLATQPAPRYLIGDRVNVTNDARVGEREIVIATGVVERISTLTTGETVYAISGHAMWCTTRVLQLIERAR